ncbi:hypothetical protein PI124_g7101 [Phytophthora idaei]|nr:hypothetical protein PI125_g10353 [Phytophthora idaei]KAG3154157.1 hypothetical protein PI126_g9749 [Phytophthora idaei]KAG3248266.1 hypothetical protein PI124_g7101 [Phytophthora idaei]
MFKKTRSSFLEGLELDGYCQEISMAFEYAGEQHETETSHFHRTTNVFYQLERDALKKFLCEKYGIKLVPIPSRFTFTDPASMKAFVCDRIKDLPQE